MSTPKVLTIGINTDGQQVNVERVSGQLLIGKLMHPVRSTTILRIATGPKDPSKLFTVVSGRTGAELHSFAPRIIYPEVR